MTPQTITAVAICSLLMAGCARIGESRFNPVNWFGSDEDTTTVSAPIIEEDPRPLIPEISDLRIERSPGGAIIRATGVPPAQGWHGGVLVPLSDGPIDGVLTFAFRAIPPDGITPSSTQQSRELVVAVFIPEQQLQRTRTVRVMGARNLRSARR